MKESSSLPTLLWELGWSNGKEGAQNFQGTSSVYEEVLQSGPYGKVLNKFESLVMMVAVVGRGGGWRTEFNEERENEKDERERNPTFGGH